MKPTDDERLLLSVSADLPEEGQRGNILPWGPPVKAKAPRELMLRRRSTEAKEPIRPLTESLAAVERHLDGGAGVSDPPPACSLCEDTGWQWVEGLVQRCWKGCDIPRKKGPHQEAEERLLKTFEGPEAFS